MKYELPSRERIAKLTDQSRLRAKEHGLKFTEMVCIAYAEGRLIDREKIDYEAGAAAEHEQWARWATTLIETEPGLSQQRIDRWAEYMVPYEELPDDVQEYDRIEMRKMLAALGLEDDDEG